LAAGSTRADEMAANRRPYWVNYKADQALNWRIDMMGRLQQITFEECSMEVDGEYGEKMVYRYRVLRPGSWNLYRKIKDGSGNETIIPDPETPGGFTSLTEIPLSVCYGRYCHPLMSSPPLLDVAVLNVTHYNQGSDRRTYLHICSRPILWAAGRDTTKNAPTLSAYTLIDVAPGGQLGYAETTGAALEAARLDEKDLEEYIGLLGLQMLAQQTPQKTATEERGDQIRELSELATAAQSLHDCLEQGLKFWARYLDASAKSGGSVELGVKSEQLMGEAAARVFLDSVGTVFTKATVRKVLAKAYADFMPEDYSDDQEEIAVEAEAQKARDNAPDFASAFNKGAFGE
jgi:hypothetical protein